MPVSEMSVEWCRKFLGAEAQGMTDQQIEQHRDVIVQLANAILNRILT